MHVMENLLSKVEDDEEKEKLRMEREVGVAICHHDKQIGKTRSEEVCSLRMEATNHKISLRLGAK